MFGDVILDSFVGVGCRICPAFATNLIRVVAFMPVNQILDDLLLPTECEQPCNAVPSLT
jgi:hypothetical protein